MVESNNIKKLVEKLRGALDIIHGSTLMIGTDAFTLIFTLFAYKRFSDTKTLTIPDGCWWNQIAIQPVDHFFAQLEKNLVHIQTANQLPDIARVLNIKQFDDQVSNNLKAQLVALFEDMDLSSAKYSTAEVNEVVGDFFQRHFSIHPLDTSASENRSLNRLALGLLNPSSDETLYFPQCGLGDVIIQAFDHYESNKYMSYDSGGEDEIPFFKASGSIYNRHIWAIVILRILLAEATWVDINNQDFFSYGLSQDESIGTKDVVGNLFKDLVLKEVHSGIPCVELTPVSGRSFLGRKRIINNILEEVIRNNNVIVVGPYGSGKTSLAHRLAEVIPQRLNRPCTYAQFMEFVGDRPPFDTINQDLFKQNEVMIVDEFEHVNTLPRKKQEKIINDLIQLIQDKGTLVILLSAAPLKSLLEGLTEDLQKRMINQFRQYDLDPFDFDLPESIDADFAEAFACENDPPVSGEERALAVATMAGLIKIQEQTYHNYNLIDAMRVVPYLAHVILFCSPIISHLPDNINTTITYKGHTFEIPHSQHELLFLFLALRILYKKGRIGIILPARFLFHEAEGSRKVREFLIDEDLLEAIVQLPSKIFPRTKVNLVLMIINTEKSKEKKKKFAFMTLKASRKDGTHFISDDSINKAIYVCKNFTSLSDSYISTAEEIRQRDYNLLPSRYVGPVALEIRRIRRSRTGRQLREISKVIRGLSTGKSDNVEGIPVIHIKDLSKDVKEIYLTFDDVWFADPLVLSNPIKERCIIVSLVGNELKPTIFDPEIAEKTHEYREILLGRNVAAIFPDNDVVDFEYLYYQLNSSLIKSQFEENLAGAGISSISLPRLKQIIVPVFDKIEEQKLFTYQQKMELLEAEKNKYEKLKERLKIDEEKQTSQYEVLGFVAHTIKNDMPIAIETIDRIKGFLEERDLLGQQIFESQSAGDLLEKADKALQQINNVVKNVRDLVSREFKRDDFQKVDICELFENELRPLMKKDYISMIVKCDVIEPIKIHKEAFIWAISNILNNAETHGFPNFVDGAEVRFDIQTNEKEMIIDYRNNGLPLPSDINTHNYTGFGTKSRGSKGYGLGGAIVSRVIKDVHNGTLELIHDKNAIHLRMMIPVGD